jgi:hypothetical protein
MLLGIDHLVIAVGDPDAAATELESRLGLAPDGGGRHDALGTCNRLIWLGDTYLELIGVFDAALAADSWVGAPTLRALERGGGLATWAIATDDMDADGEALRARGSDLGRPVPGERVRPDGRAVRWRLSASARLGPDRPPFLIEHDTTGAEWSPDDRAERAGGPASFTVLELAVDDVNPTSRAFTQTVGLRFRPSLSGHGARDADIGRQIVRLRPRRDPGVDGATIHLRQDSAQATQIDTLGCRWVVRPSEPAAG